HPRRGVVAAAVAPQTAVGLYPARCLEVRLSPGPAHDSTESQALQLIIDEFDLEPPPFSED
ncbi:MAG: hypothetical protein ACFCBW_15105, partial [Candidatus Competibacterales bacterium]